MSEVITICKAIDVKVFSWLKTDCHNVIVTITHFLNKEGDKIWEKVTRWYNGNEKKYLADDDNEGNSKFCRDFRQAELRLEANRFLTMKNNKDSQATIRKAKHEEENKEGYI